MLSSLNNDPWARPYRLVMNKHRAWMPPVTETLEPPVLNQVVDTLFPQTGEGSTLEWGLDNEERLRDSMEDVEVSGEELVRAVRRIGSRKANGIR